MDRNFAKSLAMVLRHEGGYVNHESDPGGHTNKGITLATFRRYIKPSGTVSDLKKITDAQVSVCYRRNYWDAVSGATLPDGVDYAVFDFAVNSGPSRAVKYLQRVVGVKEDGKIGPATMKAVRAMLPAGIINKLCDLRLAFLKAIKKGAQWKVFGKGWDARVKSVRIDALTMSAQPTPEKPVVIEKTVEVEVNKPVVPVSVEKGVKKKFNLFGWIGGLFSGGGLTLAGLAGMEWQAIVAIGGVLLVVFLVAILLRHQIIAGVKDLRQAVEE